MLIVCLLGYGYGTRDRLLTETGMPTAPVQIVAPERLDAVERPTWR